MPTDFLPDPIARKEWKRISKHLFDVGLLTSIDGTALAGYCTAYATLVRINKAIRECQYKVLAEKHSFLEKNSGGDRSDEVMAVELKINPLVAQQRLALQTILPYTREFGLTPSARGRMNVPGKKEVDPQEEFLND